MPSTAAWSAAILSPRPTSRDAASAPLSVARTISSARSRSGIVVMCANLSCAAVPRRPIRGVPLPDIDTIRRSLHVALPHGSRRPAARLPRRPGWRAGAGCRDRRDGRLPAALEREHRRRVRDERRRRRSSSTRPASRRPTSSAAKPEEVDLRAQHDDDQLQPRARLLPHARAGRRDRHHGARPRRERQPLAAVRQGSRPRRAHRRRARRRPAGRARGAREGRRPAHEGVRVHARLERRRHDARRLARWPTSRIPSARWPGWTACTTRRTAAST